jgi:ribose-phosphate pyrophosphokinase
MTISIQTKTNKKLGVAFLQFPGGERHVQLENTEDFSQIQSVLIRAYINSSNDLMDYLLLENALLKMKPDLNIDLELPYLPYARQDRACSLGQAFSLEVMAALLRINKKRSITVWDCHSMVGTNLTGAINLTPEKIILRSSELMNEFKNPNLVLICPDKGAFKRCETIAQAFGVKEIVHCEKIRNSSTGKITGTSVSAKDLSGKTAIITDDICDGGMTFIGIAKALKELHCSEVVLYVTHGIFSKGLTVFDGLIDRIYTSDSFPQTIHAKLTVIKV